VAVAIAAVALAGLAAWTAWLPLGSIHAQNEALALAGSDNNKALAAAQAAQDRNPLSIDPLLTRALVETTAHRRDKARDALVAAVRLQPNNPSTWEYLSGFALDQENDPELALRLLGPALYLDPQSPTGKADYLKALRLIDIQAKAKAQRTAKVKAQRAAKAKAHNKKRTKAR
jgi:tetratricopeptide (TPR) repeat protein